MVSATRATMQREDFCVPVRVKKDWRCHFCRRLLPRGSRAYAHRKYALPMNAYGYALRVCAGRCKGKSGKGGK